MLVELTAFDRPRRLGSRTTSSMMETSGTLTFAAEGEGTVMGWDWQVHPKRSPWSAPRPLDELTVTPLETTDPSSSCSLPVLDLQPAHIPVAAQIGQAECIPLVAGHHAERALGGNTRTHGDHGRRSCRTGDKRLITGSDHELRADMPLPGPIAVFHSAAKSMGRAAEMRIELTGYDRPAWLAERTTMRQAGIDGTLTFEPVPDGTRMHWSWHVRPKGPSKRWRQ